MQGCWDPDSFDCSPSSCVAFTNNVDKAAQGTNAHFCCCSGNECNVGPKTMVREEEEKGTIVAESE